MAILLDNNSTNITKTPSRPTIVQTAITRDSPHRLELGPLLNSNRLLHSNNNNNSSSSNSRLSCPRTQVAQLAQATECSLTFIQVLIPHKKVSLPLRNKQVRKRLFSLQEVEVRVLTIRVPFIRALSRASFLPSQIPQIIIANVRSIIIFNCQMYIV
jgi:hypothetical protein